MKAKTLVIVLATATLLAIVAPIAIYLWIFGASVTPDHARWAEFGSAIGGIYSPLVALLTLAVLLRQVQLQAQMNVHEFDQAFVQQAKEDIQFYCATMVEAMERRTYPGETARTFLRNHFYPSSLVELDSSSRRELAATFYSKHQPVYDVWDAIYPIIAGLEAGKAQAYQLAYHSSLQKLVAMLSFETCVTLDNFHRVRCGGRLPTQYKFSALLSKDAD